MADHAPYALFRDDKRGESLLFADPRDIVVARTASEVLPAFERLETARRSGKWLAGYVSYEAGYVFEEKLRPLVEDGRETPLIAIGIFDAPAPSDHPLAAPVVTDDAPFITEPHAGWDFAAYRQRFERLHDHLRQGDCYQANLTMPIEARWRGDPRSAFWSLVARQPVHYGALIDLGGPVILSRSPELFFKVDGEGWIETHPMKGTAPRGLTPEEDEAIIAAMLADEKTQAENRMIVDLLRNDISAISEVGTLSVPRRSR
jgi:para-aminobenzoate synthetase component 1